MSKNLTKEKSKCLEEISECEVVHKTRYLGIKVTMKNIDFFKNNYEKLWLQLNKDLIKWNKLSLSLLGCVATIKMNLLPRLMFYL